MSGIKALLERDADNKPKTVEIERKFLVKNDVWKNEISEGTETLHQGYISRDPVVRIRVYDVGAAITIKGEKEGISGSEYEYCIPTTDAFKMLDEFVGGPNVLSKRRTYIPLGGVVWEVDEFLNGKHKGLVLAEVELDSEDQDFHLPDWVGEEVSGDPQYYNSNMI